MWALSVCIFIPFYYPPLYFIIKICCICDLLHIQHFRELLKNRARMSSFDMPLLTRAQTEKECLREKRAMSEMPECWGGVAWLELAGAGSQVCQRCATSSITLEEIVYLCQYFSCSPTSVVCILPWPRTSAPPTCALLEVLLEVQTADLIQSLL